MKTRFDISAGGVLLLAALVFILNPDELAALLLAAAAHEAGHMAAIRLTGGRVTRVTLGATGAVMERTALSGSAAELFCAAAGPLAGLVYALLTAKLFPLSSGMSLVLSAFNALPALPLDGGRMLLAAAGERAAALCSLITAALVLLSGVICAVRGLGCAPLIAGGALMLYQPRV